MSMGTGRGSCAQRGRSLFGGSIWSAGLSKALIAGVAAVGAIGGAATDAHSQILPTGYGYLGASAYAIRFTPDGMGGYTGMPLGFSYQANPLVPGSATAMTAYGMGMVTATTERIDVYASVSAPSIEEGQSSAAGASAYAYLEFETLGWTRVRFEVTTQSYVDPENVYGFADVGVYQLTETGYIDLGSDYTTFGGPDLDLEVVLPGGGVFGLFAEMFPSVSAGDAAIGPLRRRSGPDIQATITVTVLPGCSVADLDANGSIDVFDLIAFLQNFDPGATCPGDSACSVSDLDNDNDIDVFDLIKFLQAFDPSDPNCPGNGGTGGGAT